VQQCLPFLVAILSGLVTWVATALFLRQYILVATIVLLIAIPLCRLNAWAVTGAFLAGLAIRLFGTNATDQLRVVLWMLVVGTALHTAVAFLPTLVKELRVPESSVGQNMLFALSGVPISYGLALVRCSGSVEVWRGLSAVSEGWVRAGSPAVVARLYVLLRCQVLMPLLELNRIAVASPASGLEFCNLAGLGCLWWAASTPIPWAIFFAAFRQVNFRLPSLAHLLGCSLLAFLGVFTTYFAYYLVLVFVAVGWMILSALDPGTLQGVTDTLGSLPLNHPFSEVALMIMVIVAVMANGLVSAFGAAWGARLWRSS
jgi:hypothetical protein